MLPLIESRRAELGDLCRRLGVRRLELFGSAAREDFDPVGSDLDFLVEFAPGLARRALDSYFMLKEALEGLFERSVDLVMPDAVTNPYVRADIERSRVTLYAA
jgi:predicted nucleotidyltransferase